jgi:hypothetical protein
MVFEIFGRLSNSYPLERSLVKILFLGTGKTTTAAGDFNFGLLCLSNSTIFKIAAHKYTGAW